MKTRPPLSLLAALPSAIGALPGTEPGNVMYVGDSITHGMNSGSYRWFPHQIFTDNGISYHVEGVKTGHFPEALRRARCSTMNIPPRQVQRRQIQQKQVGRLPHLQLAGAFRRQGKRRSRHSRKRTLRIPFS